jgi:tetratricopeptide (TPR) repeat protein
VDDWLTLSEERRLALFSRARKFAKSPEERDEIALRLMDALIERKRGAEVESWISMFEADAARRSLLVEGDRGKRLLELDPSTGFRERASIALARGVTLLERGERREALRSFAAALRAAGDSRDQTATASLSRRWLSYVLGSFETSDEIIATLKALVPPLEYNAIIEDLVWKAALRADSASFDRLVRSARHGGSFDSRVALLEPLSKGKAGALVDELVRSAADEPHAMLRFVNLLLEHVEGEELDVRKALTPLLKALSRALDAVSAQENVSKGQLRRAEELAQRNQAILSGLGLIADSQSGKARAMSPGQTAFAGNVRLAPADPIPWPFPAIDPVAPSPFRSLVLEPVEWRDEHDTLTYGWRISE